MPRLGIYLRLVLFLLIVPLGIALGQSITVTPKDAQVAVNKTRQFTATVTGLTNTDVSWSTEAGSISSTGLFTAPATVPAQNPVAITATSKSNTSVKTSVYAIILTPGPTLTSVTPNPLNTGTINVTLTGSGFQANATVLDTSNGTPVQLSTTSVTSTQIVANGYQASAPNATFTVKNPGSDSSNPVTVPISGTSYALTVVGGTGSGSYIAGAKVTITAQPGTGQTFTKWTGATVANPTAASTTLTMPAEATTVTANFTGGKYTLTVTNGTGGGSYAAGTVVTIAANAPPTGQAFNGWTGADVANADATPTTLTMPSANATVVANYTTPATIPFPVTTHPRLWVTVNDLPRLRSWAVPTNPIYAKGMANLLSQAVNIYNTQFFPGGKPNPNYPDPGDTQGYTGYLTEQYGAVLAFNSLIDPDPAKRILYAQYAHNLLMYAMNQAAKGQAANEPFRDPMFAVYNRANGSGEQWPLIVDWIYTAKDASGNAIFTPADRIVVRNVFLQWAKSCINASTTGGDHPEPIGVTNSTQLLPDNQPYRMASNNYYLGHARMLTMMALSIDVVSDAPINPAEPASKLGNTLRSYLLNANGAWLYQEYAMMGEPSAIATSYGIPGNGAGFGLSSGGLPPEGMLYGHSYAYVLGQLLALHTAGFDFKSLTGPQIALSDAPVWDRYVKGFISSLTPAPRTFGEASYLGPLYQYASYGDLLRLWATPDTMQPFALLSLLEGEKGKTTHLNEDRWFAINAVEGGADALMTHITDPWSWSSTQSILYYMLLDPNAAPATDPRPGYATVFNDAPAHRIVAHSDWGMTGSMFDYKASWESINHQDGTAGQFELYRDGEWLTKEMSNYDNNGVGFTTVYHNTLALQNWCANGTPNLGWFETGEWANGSQWILDENAGDPTTVSSSGTGYVYAASDLTKLYNRPNIWTPASGATDITQATRNILWLNNDYIVVYDRATSVHPNLFKRFNLSLVNTPTIDGHTATETMASGQSLYIQSLLPAAGTLSSAYAAGNLNPIAELEPTQYILTVQDPNLPTDTRFLHVLQGADKNVAMVKATYLVSASGTAFDGAGFGTNAVYFPTSATAAFTTTSFNLPTGTKKLLVAGLKPSTSYGVTVAGQKVTVTPGGTGATTDAAGLLIVGL